jgi:hypothetical protein
VRKVGDFFNEVRLVWFMKWVMVPATVLDAAIVLFAIGFTLSGHFPHHPVCR